MEAARPRLRRLSLSHVTATWSRLFHSRDTALTLCHLVLRSTSNTTLYNVITVISVCHISTARHVPDLADTSRTRR